MKRSLFFILLFVSLVAVSCANRKLVQPVILEKTKEVVHTVRDTTYVVESDSTYYSAYVECINGRPHLKQPQIIQPTKQESGLKAPNIVLDGNQLTVKCEKEAQALFKQWRETYIKEHEQIPILIDTPVEVVKPLSWFQKTQIWFGRIFMLLLAIVTVFAILRWKRTI